MENDGIFGATSWTTVLQVKDSPEEIRHAALERLFRRYRPAIVMEFRFHLRHSSTDPEDLAHQFICKCLEKEFLRRIDPKRGRFRGFIKTCIANYLRDHIDAESAAKRGGGATLVSLEATDDTGQRLLDPPAAGAGPGECQDEGWARQVLALALERLEQECAAQRRGSLFTELRPLLHGQPAEGGYRVIGEKLGLSAAAVAAAVHRLRQRLGELIEEEIRDTIGKQEDWRDELKYFLELIGR